MGTSYDGVYFYGIMFDGFHDDEDREGWPRVTKLAVEQMRIEAAYDAAMADEVDEDDEDENHDDDFDFDKALDVILGVTSTYNTNDPQDKRIASLEAADEERERKCIERFGCLFTFGTIGYHEYAAFYIAPVGAEWIEWRGARVPVVDPVLVETWRVALEKLREVLPGASEPGFWFGCHVG